MKPGGSLLCLQEPVTGHYPEPGESSTHSHIFLHEPFKTVLSYKSNFPNEILRSDCSNTLVFKYLNGDE
jgi:hypothetical protein